MDTVLSPGNVMVLQVSAIMKLMACWGVHMSDWAKSAQCPKREGLCVLCGHLTQAWRLLEAGVSELRPEGKLGVGKMHVGGKEASSNFTFHSKTMLLFFPN